jgi:death-on-curing family protein
MHFSNPEVESEFERWRRLIAREGERDCGIGLSAVEVLRVHFTIVDTFYGKKEGLGGIGPKSVPLLLSSVGRQHTSCPGDRVEDMVATLLYGLVMNHPFHDANKRTGFLSAMLLLYKNGLVPKVKEKQFEDFVVVVAEKKYRQFAKFKRSFEQQEQADVLYIAHYIRGATRHSDKKDYFITYRELDTILRRFGYELRNPDKGHIDVVRTDDTSVRVAHVGFHGWSKQAAKGVIRSIRTATELDILNGVDSGAFFKGEQPVTNLLAKYYEPLERLADR